MNILMCQTIANLERLLPENGTAGIAELHKMYDLTLRLQSQLLGAIYDLETFSPTTGQERLALSHSSGTNAGRVVTLMIHEPLPSMKRLTAALEEHWKEMLHTAIAEAARQETLPYFEKAMVEIRIVTPRGTNNANIWDTSNRAINVIINNLKGIFFQDDNMEHMAFSVVGSWGEEGVTILRVSELNESQQIGAIAVYHKNSRSHDKTENS